MSLKLAQANLEVTLILNGNKNQDRLYIPRPPESSTQKINQLLYVTACITTLEYSPYHNKLTMNKNLKIL